MKEKAQRKPTDNFDYLANAASATDCTGLIPSLPQTEDELDSYNDIVQYMSPAAKSSAADGQDVRPDEKHRSSEYSASS